MTDKSKPEKPQVPNLELNKETLEELPEGQGEEAKGGLRELPTATESRGPTCTCLIMGC